MWRDYRWTRPALRDSRWALDSQFEETKHPRDHGKFSSTPGAGGGAKFTDNEIQDLKHYAGEEFNRINDGLRTGKWAGLEIGDPREGVKIIDRAIEKSVIGKSGNLFRGLDAKTAKVLPIRVGATISDKGFGSFSRDPKVAKTFAGGGGVTIQFYAPASSKGIDMKEFSPRPEENEVLLPRNQSYKVIGWSPQNRILAVAKA